MRLRAWRQSSQSPYISFEFRCGAQSNGGTADTWDLAIRQVEAALRDKLSAWGAEV